MIIKTTDIEGVIEIVPKMFYDERGYFLKTYNAAILRDSGINEDFVQDNQSFSKKGVIRGLHFQKPPFEQGKLVRVITGKVLDVVVDIRKGSTTFGKYYSCILDGEINNMLYIPPGFAHGFSALEDSIFSYKCTEMYNKDAEGGIIWNDPELNINWMLPYPVISEKDQLLNSFDNFKKTL
jgi:dTDP-4-dehydrorhamnose 3,5-epimerase